MLSYHPPMHMHTCFFLFDFFFFFLLLCAQSPSDDWEGIPSGTQGA